MNIVLALLLLSFLILIHELGHFIAAKFFNVKIKEFSIFMGPKIFSKKQNGIQYSLRLIPMGGYVAMEGETEESDDKNALVNKPKWQQTIIMFAGSFVNLVFGLLVLIILTTSSGYVSNELDGVEQNIPDLNGYIQNDKLKYDTTSPTKKAGLQNGDILLKYNNRNITYPIDVSVFALENKGEDVLIEYERDGVINQTYLKPTYIPNITMYKIGVYFKSESGEGFNVIEGVSKDSPALEAGLQTGDEILEINGQKVKDRADITNLIMENRDSVANLTVLRNQEASIISIKPKVEKQKELYYDGIYFKAREGGFIKSVGAGVRYFISIIKSVYFSVIWLISGKLKLTDAMGPVGIVTTIGSVVSQKASLSQIIQQLFSMMALISINLGFINLLPIPALDGSKIVILGIEKISKKKISMEKQAIISMIGFVLLIVLLIVITGSDLMRIFGG